MFSSHGFALTGQRRADARCGVASQPLRGKSERQCLFAVASGGVCPSFEFDRPFVRALRRYAVELGIPARVVYSFGISRFST